MRLYRVVVRETHDVVYEIEAESAEWAKREVERKTAGGALTDAADPFELEPGFTYEGGEMVRRTIRSAKWMLRELDDYTESEITR